MPMTNKEHGLKRIEQYFNMSFEDIINKLHWQEQKSIKALSDLCRVSRDTFQKQAIKRGLSLRNSKEACSLTTNKGKNHWAYGIKRPDCSKRMKEKNPSFNNVNLINGAKTRSEYFKQNLLPQEIAFENILKELNIEYESQYPLNRFIIDFFIPKLNLCIEIDSKSKWGKERRIKAFIKDKFLKENGFSIIRINKRLLKDKLAIIDILNTNNIIRQQ